MAAGERLLSERPLLSWDRESDGEDVAALEAAVRALPPAANRTYWSLCQNAAHGPAKSTYGVWLSNALPTDSGHYSESGAAAVFRIACRINHSCQPNANATWSKRLQRMVVHAIMAIPAGGEIFIDYRDSEGGIRVERRAHLQSHFGFRCSCTLCSLSGEELATSDRRQRRISELLSLIAASPTPRNLVSLVEERLSLLHLEGMMNVWDTYGAAVSFLRMTGESAQAARWAGRAAACASTAIGTDSDEFQSFLAAMLSGLNGEWRAAGKRLRGGVAVLNDFAGSSAVSELRTQLTNLGDGGGGGGIEVDDPRLVSSPALRGLLFQCDQFVSLLVAHGLPNLISSRTLREQVTTHGMSRLRGVAYMYHATLRASEEGAVGGCPDGAILTCVYHLAAASGQGGSARPRGGAPPAATDRLVVFWSDHGQVPDEAKTAAQLTVITWYG